MRRSNSTVRRACAVGTTIALVGLSTGLGIMTATSASAVEPTSSTTVADSGTTAVDTTPSPSAEAPSADAPATNPSTTATPPADSPAEPAAPATEAPAAPQPTVPTTDAPSTDAPSTAPESTPRLAAAAGTVTIDGDASVGSKLTAEPSGFTAPTTLSYAWTADGTPVSQAQTYVVKVADAGKVLTVTVTNTQNGIPVESESAQTAPVTQAPVFVDENGVPITAGTTEEDDLTVSATAGERFSYTFRATGSPKPVLSLDYYYTGDEDDHEGETPADQLPEGVSFDPATGVLSGSTEDASAYDFAVTATSGTQTVTQTVELDVVAAAPVGLEAYALDRATYLEFVKSGLPTEWFDEEAQQHSGSFRSWIIKADGSVVTEKTDWETDGSFGSGFTTTDTDGGTPTVPQGGTLLLSGNLVDQYGNPVVDEETGEGADITVRSNVASDVVATDSFLGGSGFVGVTFPHASVHRLTVSAADFSTAFDVQVTPTAAVTVPTTSTPIGTVQHGTKAPAQAKGRLAYTGADETSPLAWALGLLVAGAGLIGARTVRRRRAQR